MILLRSLTLSDFSFLNGILIRNSVFLGQRSASTLQVDRNLQNANSAPENPLIEKEVNITTCESLFKRWRKERRYWKVPKAGVQFKVKYIDTGYLGSDSDTPTVVTLHGSPGSYTDFDPLTAYLRKHGVRVIAPNFPGFIKDPTSFRNTPEEKSEYVSDFLQAIDVPRVDMLVCHSSAMFPGIFLSLGNKRFSPKSLVLLNPTTLEIPRLLHPPWFIELLIRIHEFPIGHQITRFFGKRITKKSPQLKKGTFDDHFLSATTLMNTKIPKQSIHFQSLLDQNYPIMMAFSNNDKLIARSSSQKMAEWMMDPQEIERYNAKGRKESDGGDNPFRRVISFENGTHFILKTYPEIMSDATTSFLFHHLTNRVNLK